ncbi:MAG: sugar transferase [Patescibacteria group bacterium]
MKRSEIFFSLVKIPIDFVMTVCGFMAAYWLRLVTEPIEGIAKPIDLTVLPTPEQYLSFSLKTAILLLIVFAFGRMYRFKTTYKFGEEAARILTLCGVWVTTIITYFFFARMFPFSRLAIIYSWVISFIFILLGRIVIKAVQKFLLKSDIGRCRLMFVGNNNITLEIKEKIARDPVYKIVGIAEDLAELEAAHKQHRIDEIIQVTKAKDEEILQFCELNQINYRFIPDLLDVRRTNIKIETINNIPVISLKPTPLDGWGKVMKRLMDIIGAIVGLIIFSPVLLITAIAIKLNSKGPILFSKLDDGSPVKRVGKEGELFNFYKFRSMHPNTHNLRYTELSQQNIRKDTPLVKIQNDPRITSVGKFIRKYSIDELPQFWNILIGNMSLVGPRPHLPEEVAKYDKQHHFIFNIKPGLSGLAQTSGRSDLDFSQEIKLDRYYIENWSMWLDIKIIFKTFWVILKGYKE